MKSILQKLKDDNHYYGDFGKKYLSNSNIGALLSNPKTFGQPTEESLQLIQGRYFHTIILEPEKADQFDFVDASSRNTKIYKEAAAEAGKMLLLTKEVRALDEAVETLKSNEELSSEIFHKTAKYEVPMIGEFYEDWDDDQEAVMFKGKADIVTQDKIIDLKTTTGIGKFRSKAYMYNYDSQAYIYSTMFDLPFEFFVIDKDTLQMGRYACSDDFLESGRRKVEKAIKVWRKYFGPNKTHDISTHIINKTL